jgi:hypothetical protein
MVRLLSLKVTVTVSLLDKLCCWKDWIVFGIAIAALGFRPLVLTA